MDSHSMYFFCLAFFIQYNYFEILAYCWSHGLSLSLLSGISLYRHTKMSLSIHLLMDTWTVSQRSPTTDKVAWLGARWFSLFSVQPLISAQVIISWFVGSSPTLCSMQTVQSLLGILSLHLCPSPACVLSQQ